MTKRIFGISACLFLIIVMPADRALAGDLWLENLRLGDQKPAVWRLQQFLNQTPATQLAPAGPGSPGNETDYFGPLTQRAVIRLQELQASEILQPIGLNHGTGFVGPGTRAFLNRQITAEVSMSNQSITEPPPLISESNIQTIEFESSTKTPPADLADRPEFKDLSTRLDWPTDWPVDDYLILDHLSPTAGSAGAQITIQGRGFSEAGNTVYTGLSVIRGLKSPDGRRLTFILPELNLTDTPAESFSVPLWIYVRSESGLSNNLIFNLMVQ